MAQHLIKALSAHEAEIDVIIRKPSYRLHIIYTPEIQKV